MTEPCPNCKAILDSLRAELDLLPPCPEEPVQDHQWREYDEALNEGLEALRDLCRVMVSEP